VTPRVASEPIRTASAPSDPEAMMIGRSRTVAGTILVVASLSATAQAQPALQPLPVQPPLPAVRMALAKPHVLRDATARPQAALQMAGRRTGRPNSSATKATAAAAMGLVGFFVGAYLAGMTAYALKTGSTGQAPFLIGGIAGAAGGGYLGYWLASR
jgi:hypothetical protein